MWLLTRTVGIAIGGDGTPEDWGTIDAVCAGARGCWRSWPAPGSSPATSPAGRSARAWAGAAWPSSAIVVAALVTFVFSPASAEGGGDGHDHGGSEVAAAKGGDSRGRPPSRPAVTRTRPVSLNGQKITGVKAADIAAESQPDKALDPATRAQLKAELMAARDFAMRYPTVADAKAAGFYLAGGFAPGSGAHYIARAAGSRCPGSSTRTR